MKRIAAISIFSALAALAPLGVNASLTFSNSKRQVIAEKPEYSTGLDQIYVIYDATGVVATYQAQSANVEWQKFDSYGGGFAETVAPIVNGKEYSLTLGDEDAGFIISDGDKRFYCWIVNYANHYAHLDGLTFDAEQDCSRARLHLQGNAAKITYYSINGQPMELSRELEVDYNTLVFNENTQQYDQVPAHSQLSSIDGAFGVVAPFCDTEFTISGDRFLREWDLLESAISPSYQAIAVEAQTTADQEMREIDNEQKVEGGSLGGSAPVDISFTASVTDAAIFTEWQMSKDPEFEVVDDRYQELDFNYTFRENGTTYVRFVANNAAGTCEYAGETYTIFVGESALLCPNAFSPGSSEGVNDIWKVSYKSIISFECHIFNRWGQQMATFTDPSQGWDGKYKGKYVPAGAYYYVINAKGADGQVYKLSGDINIIKSKSTKSSSSNTESSE